ncbi:MAG TPA: F0F1 ATP synthase subunit epsilon [Candidatus Acidoferrum sp.]|nr:F0F1 ATP synthase subunit epsilon [Candidatus Acidoferrum sp.]
MLPAKIELEVVTPQRLILHEDVDSVELPGADGYIGVLPGHAPLLTELGIGVLTYHVNGQAHLLTVMEGYSEVLPDRVIVLADVSERAAEIDVQRSESALRRAQEQVATTSSADGDWKRAQSALERAMVRIQVASKAGN